MNVYKSAELKSTFIEITNHKKIKYVSRLYEFNDYYLNELLHKPSSENKFVILLSDFSVDLMKYDNVIKHMNFLIQPARKRYETTS